MAAATVSAGSSWASATSRWPMRPAAPTTAMEVGVDMSGEDSGGMLARQSPGPPDSRPSIAEPAGCGTNAPSGWHGAGRRGVRFYRRGDVLPNVKCAAVVFDLNGTLL